MDMQDVMVRADVESVLAERLGVEKPGRRGMVLEGRWLAVWGLFEASCRNYAGEARALPLERAVELVAAVQRAWPEFREYESIGFLAFLYDELLPGRDRMMKVPEHVEWAAAPFEAVRAGLGPADFERWVAVLASALSHAVEERTATV